MPQFAIDLRPTNTVTYVSAYRKAEGGRLKSVVVTQPGPLSWSIRKLFVVVGTMQGGRGDEFITAVFCSKYFSWRDMVGWTGDYPFAPYEEIFVKALSDGAGDIRVVGTIEIGDP